MSKIRYYALFWALVLSSVLVLGTGSYFQTSEESALEAAMGLPERMQATEPVTEATTEPTAEPTTEPTTQPTTEPVTEPSTEATVETEPEPTEPLAVYGEDESYFDDVLFIGDSRVDGLRLYSPIGEASYFCTTGLTVFDVFEVTAPNKELVYQTLEEVLSEREFGKIYIALGLNEASAEDEVLVRGFMDVLDGIREWQPEAELVLHGIMPLGKEKSESADYFAMERIREINELIRGIAEEIGGHYLDASAVVAGEDGYMREDLSYDGCHLYARNYWMWAQFLCENAV